jgi:hypothetical protein
MRAFREFRGEEGVGELGFRRGFGKAFLGPRASAPACAGREDDGLGLGSGGGLLVRAVDWAGS